MLFRFLAVDMRGQKLTDTLEAADLAAAQQELMRRGLMVMKLDETPATRGTLGFGAGGAKNAKPGATSRELANFSRQMAMMLRAGASVVPAMQAICEQPGRARWKALLEDLSERVEAGNTLKESMARHPSVFSSSLRTIIAAGEATGSLGESFARISQLLDARLRMRKSVVGALVYPAMLFMMAGSVTSTMTFFVLPRFTQLFKMLNTPVPALTQFMLDTSDAVQKWWLPLILAPLAAISLATIWARSERGRELLSSFLLRIPLIGSAISGVLLASILNIWSALLRSKVPLLDAVREARGAVGNPQFRRLIDDIEDSITQGRGMTAVLKQSRLVPSTIAATLHIGEESGKLGDAMEFTAAWLEEENDALIKTITRALEPAILIIMGIVVGGVCVSLFLPLFDIATAAG